MEVVTKFLSIPWEDVIHPHILEELTMEDLINLQRADSSFEDVVRTYIETFTNVKPQYMKNDVIKDVLRQTKRLKILYCSHLDWLTDDYLHQIIENNSCSLEIVKISCCKNVTPEGLRSILLIRDLRFLDVSNNAAMNDQLLLEIGVAQPLLEYIDICRCKISDAAIKTFRGKCKRLNKILSFR